MEVEAVEAEISAERFETLGDTQSWQRVVMTQCL